MRVVVVGAVVLVVVGVAALARDGLGLATVWPVVVGLPLALAAPGAGRDRVTALGIRLAAAVVGVLVGWVTLAVRMGLLAPDLPASDAIVWTGAILVVAVLAIPFGTDALWAAALGAALFHGIYEPILAADPAAFLTTSPPAIVTTMVALGLGAGAGVLGREVAAFVGARDREAAPDTALEA